MVLFYTYIKPLEFFKNINFKLNERSLDTAI